MNPESQCDRQHDDEIDLVEYLKVIYKRWKIISAVVFVSMLFTIMSGLSKPRMYESQATFFPLDVHQNMQLDGSIIRPQLNVKELIISMLGSRKMADRIIEQLDLKKLWKDKSMLALEITLKNKTEISSSQNGLIKLSVRDENPELSAKIANAYVDNLEYFNKELELGVQRQVVQVIDRAVVPEEKMARGIKKNVLLAGAVSLFFSVLVFLFSEFVRKSDIKRRLKGN